MDCRCYRYSIRNSFFLYIWGSIGGAYNFDHQGGKPLQMNVPIVGVFRVQLSYFNVGTTHSEPYEGWENHWILLKNNIFGVC